MIQFILVISNILKQDYIKRIPSRNKKEYQKYYYQVKLEEKKQYQREYYDRNKEAIKKKYNCVCGGKYNLSRLSRHILTYRHQEYLDLHLSNSDE